MSHLPATASWVPATDQLTECLTFTRFLQKKSERTQDVLVDNSCSKLLHTTSSIQQTHKHKHICVATEHNKYYLWSVPSGLPTSPHCDYHQSMSGLWSVDHSRNLTQPNPPVYERAFCWEESVSCGKDTTISLPNTFQSL